MDLTNDRQNPRNSELEQTVKMDLGTLDEQGCSTRGDEKPFVIKGSLPHCVQKRNHEHTKQSKDGSSEHPEMHRKSINKRGKGTCHRLTYGTKLLYPLQVRSQEAYNQLKEKWEKRHEEGNVPGPLRCANALERPTQSSSTCGSVSRAALNNACSLRTAGPVQENTNAFPTTVWIDEIAQKRMRTCAAASPSEEEVSFREFVDGAFKSVAIKGHEFLSFAGDLRIRLRNEILQKYALPEEAAKRDTLSRTLSASQNSSKQNLPEIKAETLVEAGPAPVVPSFEKESNMVGEPNYSL